MTDMIEKVARIIHNELWDGSFPENEGSDERCCYINAAQVVVNCLANELDKLALAKATQEIAEWFYPVGDDISQHELNECAKCAQETIQVYLTTLNPKPETEIV